MARQLSAERVITAAVELADREGIEAVTMRRLADELGAGAMSLYHHVPSKDALLDGMVDRVFAEIELPATDLDWKKALRRRAVSTRQALRRHPWALGRMESTRSPGPSDLRLHDAVLGCLRRAGFSVATAVQAYSVQDAYIYGFALQEKTVPLGAPEDLKRLARERVEEIQSRMAGVARLYPYLAEVVGGYVAREGMGPEDAFEFGLDVILNGLEALRS